KTLLFARRLSGDELREEFVTRLKTEYDVGYVDVDLTPDGTVEYLGLGRRARGLSHSLAPGSAAVAITADPPPSASFGDVVQIWETASPSEPPDVTTDEAVVEAETETETETPERPEPSRVGVAEIRGIAGQTVTLALDEATASEVAGGEYRLVTLPAEPRTDREFAELLRAADATMSPVRVDPGSPATATTVDELPGLVVALAPETGPLVALPSGDRAVVAGDTVYVIGLPDVIREVEASATNAEPADAESVATEQSGP
ncbi:MAG: hypothetical protein ABEI99_02245, partial [Halobaculum sp.]